MGKEIYKMGGKEHIPFFGLIKYTKRIRELPPLQKVLMLDKFDDVFDYHLLTTGAILAVGISLGLEALL